MRRVCSYPARVGSRTRLVIQESTFSFQDQEADKKLQSDFGAGMCNQYKFRRWTTFPFFLPYYQGSSLPLVSLLREIAGYVAGLKNLHTMGTCCFVLFSLLAFHLFTFSIPRCTCSARLQTPTLISTKSVPFVANSVLIKCSQDLLSAAQNHSRV